MAEGPVDRTEVRATTGWSRQLDESLTWVRTYGRYSPGHLLWWPGLDQKITDFHARYERACLED
ncbi:MAG TPA: hypothetical protein VF960_03680 [Chloroflexota bacterium]